VSISTSVLLPVARDGLAVDTELQRSCRVYPVDKSLRQQTYAPYVAAELVLHNITQRLQVVKRVKEISSHHVLALMQSIYDFLVPFEQRFPLIVGETSEGWWIHSRHCVVGVQYGGRQCDFVVDCAGPGHADRTRRLQMGQH